MADRSIPIYQGVAVNKDKLKFNSALNEWKIGSILDARGQLLTHDGVNDFELPIGPTNSFLVSNGTDPIWKSSNLGFPFGEIDPKGWLEATAGMPGQVFTVYDFVDPADIGNFLSVNGASAWLTNYTDANGVVASNRNTGMVDTLNQYRLFMYNASAISIPFTIACKMSISYRPSDNNGIQGGVFAGKNVSAAGAFSIITPSMRWGGGGIRETTYNFDNWWNVSSYASNWWGSPYDWDGKEYTYFKIEVQSSTQIVGYISWDGNVWSRVGIHNHTNASWQNMNNIGFGFKNIASNQNSPISFDWVAVAT